MADPDAGAGVRNPPPITQMPRDPKKDPRPGHHASFPRPHDYFPNPFGKGGGNSRETGVRLISAPTVDGAGLAAFIVRTSENAIQIVGVEL
jgi:hypothetical protein